MSRRIPIGTSSAGGVFCFDPFDLYSEGVLQNPNVFVLGQIGRGKSAFVKSLLARGAVAGRAFSVLDPKSEYGPFARRMGAEVVEVGGGKDLLLDPFSRLGELIPSTRGQWQEVVERLLGIVLQRELEPLERFVVGCALDRELRRANPFPDLGVLASALRSSQDLVAGWTVPAGRIEEVALALHVQLMRLLDGDLDGVVAFDHRRMTNATNVVFDLSRAYNTRRLPLAVSLVMEEVVRRHRDGSSGPGFLVVDEAWAVLLEPAASQWLRASFKLARSLGIANVAVTHRISDLEADARGGVGLIPDAESFVIYGQHSSEVGRAAEVLEIPHHLASTLPQLPRGVALWKVAGRFQFVRHLLEEGEIAMVDTDRSMRAEGVAEDDAR